MKSLRVIIDRCPKNKEHLAGGFDCDGCEYRNMKYTVDRKDRPFKETIRCNFKEKLNENI